MERRILMEKEITVYGLIFSRTGISLRYTAHLPARELRKLIGSATSILER